MRIGSKILFGHILLYKRRTARLAAFRCLSNKTKQVDSRAVCAVVGMSGFLKYVIGLPIETRAESFSSKRARAGSDARFADRDHGAIGRRRPGVIAESVRHSQDPRFYKIKHRLGRWSRLRSRAHRCMEGKWRHGMPIAPRTEYGFEPLCRSILGKRK